MPKMPGMFFLSHPRSAREWNLAIRKVLPPLRPSNLGYHVTLSFLFSHSHIFLHFRCPVTLVLSPLSTLLLSVHRFIFQGYGIPEHLETS